MMLAEILQVGLQVGGGALLTVNTVLLLNLSYSAGRLVEKVDGIEKRTLSLEGDRCPHPKCPLRARFDLDEGQSE